MENCNCHILEIINKILLLQKQEFDDDLIGCDRPFLGPTSTITTYNTRPIILYNRYTAEEWNFSVDNDTQSNIFRIEDVEQCSVTVRLLIPNETGYTNTNQFVTIDLSTVGAIRCLSDTFITL